MIRDLLRFHNNSKGLEAAITRLMDDADNIASKSQRRAEAISETILELTEASTAVRDEQYRAQEIRRKLSDLLNI